MKDPKLRLRAPEEPVKSLPTAEALAHFIIRQGRDKQQQAPEAQVTGEWRPVDEALLAMLRPGRHSFEAKETPLAIRNNGSRKIKAGAA